MSEPDLPFVPAVPVRTLNAPLEVVRPGHERELLRRLRSPEPLTGVLLPRLLHALVQRIREPQAAGVEVHVDLREAGVLVPLLKPERDGETLARTLLTVLEEREGRGSPVCVETFSLAPSANLYSPST